MAIAQPPIPVRETPAAESNQPNPAFPDASNERVLDMDQIQGNIIPGFLKDFETLLFLKITNPRQCKQWLKEITPSIATAQEVFAFNRLFKKIRYRRGYEPEILKATWINIAFSFLGLRQLVQDADRFTDQAFKDGLAARSQDLGDPTSNDDEGNTNNWIIGGPGNEADILLIVQSDDMHDLQREVQHIKQTIYNLSTGKKRIPSGVVLMHEEQGANLPGILSGHEHFGFLDGVSQPGIRGRVSENAHDVLTPRQNPRDPDQGKPGQDLLWPGEFVFGYQHQDPAKEIKDPSDDDSSAGPEWAKNGSYLVFRRLRQDVGAFHTFLKNQAQQLDVPAAFLGAKIIGRWPDGEPIMRDQQGGNQPMLGNDDCANNDFEFVHQDPSLDPQNPSPSPPDELPPAGTSDQCHIPQDPNRSFTPSPGDPGAQICPFAGHIRKAYPRDDITPEGRAKNPQPGEESEASEPATQTHRLLRRGLPYGKVSPSTFDDPVSDNVDRGLLFIAYQTSIERQFEFVTKSWVNNRDFSQQGAGFDLVIGQNNQGNHARMARISLHPQKNQTVQLQADEEWVIPTGGGYFFAPSIEALDGTLSQ
ncbi:peroxidase [Reticulibacter mediterranei]|uniref:Peroxidase n=1 Tax=Reticulibacter mediterranei TaxID=2778369 RepID=A0A8J3IRS4_9CHLR|nr:Dyp-type peroxidase [Reticulibacter mediterranei]GHO97423.1 peroxidase [Reticulibacter mediterranei]